FAVTLAVAIGVSAVLSLSLTPMMCAHLLKHVKDHGKGGNWFERGSEKFFDWMIAVYDRGLVVVLRHRTLTLLATFATVALTAVLAIVVPKGFFPQEDTGSIQGVTEAAPDVSFARMSALQEIAANAVLEDPDVASVASFIGADGTNSTPNTGRLSI